MTYTIKRTNKKLPKVLKNTFSSYEEARNAARRWLLSMYGHRLLSLEGFSVQMLQQ